MVNPLNKVLGVELLRLDELQWVCSTCLVSKTKQTLNIENRQTNEGLLTEVLKALPKTYPISLTVNGKGIIHKNLHTEEEYSFVQIFQKAFPSVDIAQFYVQQYTHGRSTLLSIIRRQEIDDLLKEVRQAGLIVFVVSLGAAVSTFIWPQLGTHDKELRFNGHVFELTENGMFLSYQYNQMKKVGFLLKVGHEPIAEAHILAYASAFQLLLYSQITWIEIKVVPIENNFSNFLINAQLKKRAALFLFGLMLALMVSYFLFTTYNHENEQRKQTLGTYTTNAEQIIQLKKNIANNEELLKKLAWNGGFNYGFLINEIAVDMPAKLQLLEISMNELKEDNPLPNPATIKIVGLTSTLSTLNDWQILLKKKTWIKTLSITKYQENEAARKYQFNLMITYGDMAEVKP